MFNVHAHLHYTPIHCFHSHPIIHTPHIRKLQHGQSQANAAEASGEDRAQDRALARWHDSPLTAAGRMQAAALAPSAARWGVERVLVSPLVRAIETAAHVFATTLDVPLQLCAAAREGWWDAPENRGRLAAGLAAGTETGAEDEPRRWRRLSELPGNCCERLEGLEALERPVLGEWAPEEEAGLAAEDAEACWRASLDRLCLEISSSSCKVLAVVCHRGVIDALFGVQTPNCGVVKSRWWMEGRRCKREVVRLPGDVSPPPLDSAQEEEEEEEKRCVWFLWRAALPSVEQLARSTPALSAACDETAHASGNEETVRWLQVLLAMCPADDAAGGGGGGGGVGRGGASMERGKTFRSWSHVTRLEALDNLVRHGFGVLTQPCAHAAQAPPLVAAWRRTFALSATLRAREWLRRKRWGHACRLLDLALLLGGEWPDGALGCVCHPMIRTITTQLALVDGESPDAAVLLADGAAEEGGGEGGEGSKEEEEEGEEGEKEEEEEEQHAGAKRRRTTLNIEPWHDLPLVEEFDVLAPGDGSWPGAAMIRIEAAKGSKCGVHLYGAMADWEALSTWGANFAALRCALAIRTVPVEVGLRVWGERAAAGRQQVLCRFDSFIDQVVLGRGTLACFSAATPLAITPVVPVTAAKCQGYVAQHLLFQQCPHLLDGIGWRFLEIARDTNPLLTRERGRVWIGPAGTVTPLHFDFHENVLCQLLGCKLVLLCEGGIEEGEREAFYPCDGVANASRVDAENPDLAAFPLFARVVRRTCVLSPGQALFIPKGVWHYAKSLSPSASVSFWFNNND